MAEPTTPVRRSPLAHRAAIAGEGGSVRIAELPFLGKHILRADPNAAADQVAGALGFGLPTTPLTSATSGGTSALWLGPDEWMIVTAPDAAAEQSAAVRNALAGTHHQLAEVSNYYTIIEVAGPKARELLMKLTTLDLHPRAFKVGMVAGSMFGRANATLWRLADDTADGGPVFRLFTRWSMADYLWCLIANAGREWGVLEQRPVGGEKLTIGN